MKIYLVSSLYTLLNVSHYHQGSFKEKGDSILIVFGGIRDYVFHNYSYYESLFNEVRFEEHTKDLSLYTFLKTKWAMYRLFMGVKSRRVQVVSQNYSFTLVLPLRIRNNMRLSLIEEGLSTYTDFNQDLKFRNRWLVFLNKYLPFLQIFPKCDSILLYEPNIYLGCSSVTKLGPFKPYFPSPFPISDSVEMPDIVFLGTPIDTLKNVLSYKLNKEAANVFQESVLDIRDKVVNLISGIGGYYKLHPSERNMSLEVLKYESSLPWEVDIRNLSNNATLISYFSTTLLTPKLLYGKEPRIIFLFRLLPAYEFFRAEEILRRLREIYLDPKRICVPESLKELNEILQ